MCEYSRAAAGTPTCARILFVWAVRDLGASPPTPHNKPPTNPSKTDHIQWITPLLAPALAHVPPTLALSLQFHITGVDPADGDSSSSTPSSSSALSLSDGDAEKALPTPTSGSDSGVDPEKGDDGVEKGAARALLASASVRVLRGRPDVALLLGEALRADGTSHVSVNGASSPTLSQGSKADALT